MLAVLLTAAAVTLAGPIGFVGFCAPAVTRMSARLIPALHRHAVLVPAAGLVGALTVVAADGVIRALLGADRAGQVPTGVATTLVGAVLLVVLARLVRDCGPTRQPPGSRMGPRGRRRYWTVLAVVGATAAGTGLLGLLAGNTWLLTGDIVLRLSGEGPPVVRFALDERPPRVAAALAAGGALALSGSLVQATCRNPLAEPGILGITGGAGLAALSVTAIGVVGFVGLVAPHAARALVGGRHARIVPVAVLLGAVLLGLADTVGRTVVAPAQLPAGLAVALIGAPYSVYLLARSRA